jgi:hypothetical protein
MTKRALAYYLPAPPVTDEPVHEADIVIYGATAAGIIAAIEARARNHRVLVLNPGWHVGGMTTSGLGFTDFGNEAIIGGLARRFYQLVGRHYGTDLGWAFEPGTAASVLAGMMRAAGVNVLSGFYAHKVVKQAGRILEIVSTSGQRVRASLFLDCSYEGDLLPLAGVSNATGREANSVYDETFNGVQILDKNQFELGVDPFIRPGDPASGLLPGVHTLHPGVQGAGDQLIQAYNFRVCMTRRPELRVPFHRPADYSEHQYELLARYFAAGWRMDLQPDGSFAKYDEVANGKTDTNNGGAFASDFIGGNWDFPQASYERREQIYKAHVNYHQGLLYFLQNSPRVPRAVQAAIREYGLAGDEFTGTQNWPPQLYIRECRRLVGDLVVTEHHCLGRARALNSIGMAAYTMDSHNCQRVVVKGRVYNEGDVQVRLPAPYGIPYHAITPKRCECVNLLVPVCLSATHIAFGSIRMEPVFMGLAQAAAIAASLCLPELCPVQELQYAELRPHLKRAGLVLDLDEIDPELRSNSAGNPTAVLARMP